MTRPIDVVRKLCPKARASYLSAFENGDGLFQKHDITSPLRLEHFLAQCLHETGGLTVEWESGAYSAARLLQIFGVGHHSAGITPSEAAKLDHNGPAIFERVYGLGNPRKAKELGNTQPGDGFRYRGGGIMQTTGRANYRRMGQRCGVDFEGNPELVLSAEHALKPALAEWTEGKLNVAADRDDILTITKRINGGTNGLDDRKVWLGRLKSFINARLPIELGPAPGPAPAAPPPGVPRRGTVTSNALNLREEPNATAAILEVVNKGTSIETVGEVMNGWVKVTVPSGRTGWMASRFISRDE